MFRRNQEIENLKIALLRTKKELSDQKKLTKHFQTLLTGYRELEVRYDTLKAAYNALLERRY